MPACAEQQYAQYSVRTLWSVSPSDAIFRRPPWNNMARLMRAMTHQYTAEQMNSPAGSGECWKHVRCYVRTAAGSTSALPLCSASACLLPGWEAGT